MATNKARPPKARPTKAIISPKEVKAAKEAVAAKAKAAAIEKLEPIAHEINVRLKKGDDNRLAAALKLEEARQLCKENKIDFKEWVKKSVEWSYETVRKLVVVGQSDNPQKAIEDLRKGAALRNQKLRARKRAKVSQIEAKVSNPKKLIGDLIASDEEAGLKVVEQAVGEFGFGLASDADVKELRQRREAEKKTKATVPASISLEDMKGAYTRLTAGQRMDFLRYAAKFTGMELVDPTTKAEKMTLADAPAPSEGDIGDDIEKINRLTRRRRAPAEATA